jgi:hypothetical protein
LLFAKLLLNLLEIKNHKAMRKLIQKMLSLIVAGALLTLGSAVYQDVSGENELTPELNTYPNPANENLYVEVTLNTVQQFEVELYDLTGRKVLSEEVKNPVLGINRITLPVNELKHGIYILRINNDAFTKSKRVQIK